MHIEPKPTYHYPWYIRIFFWFQQQKYGKVLEPGLVWGRVPRLFAPLALLYGGIDRKSSAIDPQLRSLITVRISQINWCEFCVDINSATLQKRGCSLAKIEKLNEWRDSELFDEREQACLDYAEHMTDSSRRVTDEVMGKVKKFFSEDALVDLTGLIAFQNMSSKFNAALQIPPQGFCTPPTSKKDA